MSILAKRASLVALTVVGLVLLVVGVWFTVHLGTSGSATFRATPRGGVVVLEPSVLNRVNQPTTVTATTPGGATVWMGLASPSDVRSVVGAAERTDVTGAHVQSWSLRTAQEGAGPAPELPTADIWHRSVSGKGSARLSVDQSDAPEALVVAAPDVSTVTLTVQRRTWFFQAMLTALVGLLAASAGAAGLAQELHTRLTRTPAEAERAVEEVRA